ncbi:sigma-70 family RNA polymerase sigma factor [Scopulibacillus daqui]|uniref:sigma-70 family RNA polymerase sigma factor n=1 Tax=Scopulibacillus daqui TaxID=1469162 RepID=UPI00195FE7F5|nr:sigma-70 family RNA polymerase sigma factor [Scopulibacillus daqui]
MIKVEAFWEWAEKNKNLIDFRKIPKNILVPEPKWVDEQRRIDFKNRPSKRQRHWTSKEDDRLWQLFYIHQYTIKEIAEMMGRSKGSICGRIHRLRKLKQVS